MELLCGRRFRGEQGLTGISCPLMILVFVATIPLFYLVWSSGHKRRVGALSSSDSHLPFPLIVIQAYQQINRQINRHISRHINHVIDSHNKQAYRHINRHIDHATNSHSKQASKQAIQNIRDVIDYPMSSAEREKKPREEMHKLRDSSSKVELDCYTDIELPSIREILAEVWRRQREKDGSLATFRSARSNSNADHYHPLASESRRRVQPTPSNATDNQLQKMSHPAHLSHRSLNLIRVVLSFLSLVIFLWHFGTWYEVVNYLRSSEYQALNILGNLLKWGLISLLGIFLYFSAILAFCWASEVLDD